MRSTAIRTATFATILILPLSLPQAGPSGEIGSIFSVSKASADGTFNRMMRWTGYGWSCGYHACNNNGWGLRDGLPPVGNKAHQTVPASPGKFELAEPVAYQVLQSGGHPAHGHHQTHRTHDNYAETVPMGSVPLNIGPYGEVGGSLVVPQPHLPGAMIQPYRSVIPPNSPSKPAKKSEDSKTASPSDLEVLPSPRGEADERDGLKLDDSSVRLVPPRNRSASKTVALKSR